MSIYKKQLYNIYFGFTGTSEKNLYCDSLVLCGTFGANAQNQKRMEEQPKVNVALSIR